jgi:hypothetical protein
MCVEENYVNTVRIYVYTNERQVRSTVYTLRKTIGSVF